MEHCRGGHRYPTVQRELTLAVCDRGKLSGQSTLEFARAKLFNPLGIRTDGAFEPELSDRIDAATVEAYERASVAWPVDPQGYHDDAAGLRLPARDQVKFGLFVPQRRPM